MSATSHLRLHPHFACFAHPPTPPPSFALFPPASRPCVCRSSWNYVYYINYLTRKDPLEFNGCVCCLLRARARNAPPHACARNAFVLPRADLMSLPRLRAPTCSVESDISAKIAAHDTSWFPIKRWWKLQEQERQLGSGGAGGEMTEEQRELRELRQHAVAQKEALDRLAKSVEDMSAIVRK